MNPQTIKQICIESCEATYEYLEFRQFAEDPEAGRVTYQIDRIENKGDYIILHVPRRIPDTTAMGLQVNNKSFFGDDVNFDCYDEDSLSITLYPSQKVRDLILSSDKPNIQLLIDLKWLISNTQKFYELYGDELRIPPKAPVFHKGDYSFPKGLTPSEQQKVAVDTVLNSKLAYVWGAPGTGKTQFVLATSIMAYLRQGKRVAVVTPTNNSLEQVLRGLLNVIEREDPDGKIVNLDRDVIRLGLASPEFQRKYPNVCTRKGILKQIGSKEQTIETLKRVAVEKRIEGLKPKIREIIDIINEEEGRHHLFGKKKGINRIMDILDEIRSTLALDPNTAHLADGIDEFNVRQRIGILSDDLYGRPRPHIEIEEYQGRTVEDIEVTIRLKEEELEELRQQEPKVRVASAKILAMTTHKLMLVFGPFYASNHTELNVDHIFIDEVGYCNLIQTLPVFTFGVPVSMLGDHKQLPPVCEIDEEVIKTGIEKKGSMRYAFLWDQSALHCESFFSKDIDEMAADYDEGRDAAYMVTKQCDLTESHRFGDNLARILDAHVYHNGIRGLSKTPLEIVCIDTFCTRKADRENPAEALAIKDYLARNPMKKSQFAILTPYKKQKDELKWRMKEYDDNIMTIHGSQGREWDTVFLSVADNRVANKDVHLRFTSTLDDGVGTNVINTAVSRAKKRLVLVCDCEFWLTQNGEMISDMVRKADVNLKYDYKGRIDGQGSDEGLRFFQKTQVDKK